MRRSTGGRLRPSRSRCVLEGLTWAWGPTLHGAATMQLAMIGLGRMGGNMVQRLLQGGHQLVVFDRSANAVKPHVAMGATGAKDLADLCGQLRAPRVVWVMVPAGAAVEGTIKELLPGLSRG